MFTIIKFQPSMVTKIPTTRTSYQLDKYEEKRWETPTKTEQPYELLHLNFLESFQQSHHSDQRTRSPKHVHKIWAQSDYEWPFERQFDQNCSTKKWQQGLVENPLFFSSYLILSIALHPQDASWCKPQFLSKIWGFFPLIIYLLDIKFINYC